jgi:hypothetical protein
MRRISVSAYVGLLFVFYSVAQATNVGGNRHKYNLE